MCDKKTVKKIDVFGDKTHEDFFNGVPCEHIRIHFEDGTSKDLYNVTLEEGKISELDGDDEDCID